MGSQFKGAGPFKFAWIWIAVLSALFILPTVSARAEEKNRLPNLESRLPELQKAVGKDWFVTALPDGYLVTYTPRVSFYPAISESSKLDNQQRAERGRMDYLRIRITFLFPPTMKSVDQFNAFWRAVRPAPGYFECGAEDWEIWGDGAPKSRRLALFTSSTLFASNFAPNQLVSPREMVDVYEQTLDALAPLFCCARHENWD